MRATIDNNLMLSLIFFYTQLFMQKSKLDIIYSLRLHQGLILSTKDMYHCF